MRRKIILGILMLMILICPVTAANITNCDVTDTVIYGTSNVYDISSGGTFDSNSVATGIINSNTYVYGSPIAEVNGNTVDISIDDLRGALSTQNENGYGAVQYFEVDDNRAFTELSSGVYPVILTLTDNSYLLSVAYGNALGNYGQVLGVPVHTQAAWSITPEQLEIEKKTSNTYNPTNQFSLTNEIIDVKFISTTDAILIYGNSVYRIEADANTITALNNTANGAQITKGYIGTTGAVTVDTQGKVLFYDYATGSVTGINTIYGATQITDVFCNGNYVVINSQNNSCSVYSTTTGEMISSTDISIDNGDINNNYFVFSDGATLKSLTSLMNAEPTVTTLTTLPSTITSVTAVKNTNTFIMTTENVTYVANMGTAGTTYTQVSVSTDTTPLSGITYDSQANYAGYNGETVYWNTDEGESLGSYTLTQDINAVSLAWQNGLWSAVGGDNMAVYIMAQEAGAWGNIQSIILDNTVQNLALSDSGYYLVSATENTLYLFSRATPLDVSDTILTTKYYLEISTYVDGIIQSGQSFTVSYQGGAPTTYTTVTSGTYTIEVYPTYTYVITYGDKTIRYVANNYALQYLILDTGDTYYLDGVTYGSSLVDNSKIQMYYQDSKSNNNLIRFMIQDTEGTILYDSGLRQTNAFSQQYTLNTDEWVKVTLTISRPNGMRITLSDGVTKTLTWSFHKQFINPQGEIQLPGATKPLFPAQLPMIDGVETTDQIKQIFFCGILMVIAGLFGANHSAKGTLVLGFVALLFTFFGFIHIDWMWAMMMVVIGVLTIFSYANN